MTIQQKTRPGNGIHICNGLTILILIKFFVQGFSLQSIYIYIDIRVTICHSDKN
jgi:hypothetical protein